MTPRLSPVPDAPRRVVGLVRVSEEREVMISPENQRLAIADYCRKRGYDLADVVEGIDESGSQRRSAWWTRLDQVVAAVEAGTYDGVVVWKFSRTARHRLRWAVALDRVEVAGGVLESATEQFDTSTSAGRFARGMLAELGAFEAERIGETWKEAHQARVRAGKPASGKPRYGYTYDRDGDKVHRPDPVTGPLLADLYRRYVAGEGFPTLVAWLNARRMWTTSGGPWADRTLRRVMDTGFAAGLFTHRGVTHQGVHEPLIDSDLWEAYQARRAATRNTAPAVAGSTYLLSGLVLCAGCGASMHGSKPSRSSRDVHRYKCRTRAEFGSGLCGLPTARMEQVDDAVRAWVLDLADDLDQRSAVVEADLAARRVVGISDAERLQRELAKVEAALSRLTMQNLTDPLPEAVYADVRRQLDDQHATISAQLETAREAARAPAAGVVESARSLTDDWDVLAAGVRRAAVSNLVGAVVVRGGNPAHVRVIPRWELRP